MPEELTPANQAIEEIKAILKKHDLAGMIYVSSPDEMAYLKEITPSWSCAFWENHPSGMMLRVRCKREDYPSKEAQKKCLEDTIGMFIAFHNEATRQADDMFEIVQMLSRSFDIAHIERPNQ